MLYNLSGEEVSFLKKLLQCENECFDYRPITAPTRKGILDALDKPIENSSHSKIESYDFDRVLFVKDKKILKQINPSNENPLDMRL